MKRESYLLTALCGLILAACSVESKTVLAPLPITDVLKLRSFAFRSPIKLSPDGQWVAYTLQGHDSRQSVDDRRFFYFSKSGVSREAIGSSVWITNTRSGETKQLLTGGASSWGPSWSPDNRCLAFYSDSGGQAALWIWERQANKVRRISREVVRPLFLYEVPEWTPDSRGILVKLLPKRLSIETAADLLVGPKNSSAQLTPKNPSSVVVFESSVAKGTLVAPTSTPQIDDGMRYLSDLAMVEPGSGRVVRIVSECKATGYWISPDGSRVAFTDFKGKESPVSQQLLRDLIVVSANGSQRQLLASNVKMTYGISVSWSPNSEYLAYIASGRDGSISQSAGDCFLASVREGTTKNLTPGTHPNFGTNYYRQPLWDPTGQSVYLIGNNSLWVISIPDGRLVQLAQGLDRDIVEVVGPSQKGRVWSPDGGQSIFVSTLDRVTNQVGFYRIDLAKQTYEKSFEEKQAYGSPLNLSIDVAGDSSTVVWIAQQADRPANIWCANVQFKSGRKITNINPAVEKYVMGSSRSIQWTNEDGETLRGVLLLPSDYKPGNRYPLVVEVYGGIPASRYAYRFGVDGTGAANKQLLATRGYAVLLPELPMRIGSPMKDVARAILPAVDQAVALGIADPERLGVTGKSYGGYCTLSLIVQTSRFKAAISRAGPGNLLSAYGVLGPEGEDSVDWAEDGQGRMGGTPWKYRERYIENSPVFFLDNVSTPLLLVHGTADSAVPVFLSDEVFVGLRRLGKEVTYARYPNQDHTEDSFNYDYSVDYFNRMIAWFDKYLKNSER